MDALNRKKWLTAREFFKQLNETYVQSPIRPDAKLGIGDTYVGEHGASSEYDDRAERYLELMDQVPFRWRMPDGYPDLGPRWRGMHMLVGRWNYALALCEERLTGLTFDEIMRQPPEQKKAAPESGADGDGTAGGA